MLACTGSPFFLLSSASTAAKLTGAILRDDQAPLRRARHEFADFEAQGRERYFQCLGFRALPAEKWRARAAFLEPQGVDRGAALVGAGLFAEPEATFAGERSPADAHGDLLR